MAKLASLATVLPSKDMRDCVFYKKFNLISLTMLRICQEGSLFSKISVVVTCPLNISHYSSYLHLSLQCFSIDIHYIVSCACSFILNLWCYSTLIVFCFVEFIIFIFLIFIPFFFALEFF